MIAKWTQRWIHGVAGIVVAMLTAWSTARAPETATAQIPTTTGAPAAKTFKVSGRVLKSSGQKDVYVALWRAEGFREKPARQIHIKPGDGLDFLFEVPAGRWAVSAFEDANGNGVLDMGTFGPKEPSGFWRAFNGRRKPRFEDVCFPINKDTSGADITLK